MEVQMHKKRLFSFIAGLSAAVLILAGCSSSSNSDSTATEESAASTKTAVPDVPKLESLGAGEGAVNIVAWAGYVENGSTDPKVDWVTGFEKETGCKVNVKNGCNIR